MSRPAYVVKIYFSFQFDRLEPGLCGRHPQSGAEATKLPPGDGDGHGCVLRPHPHRVHHRWLGRGHQGHQGQLP